MEIIADRQLELRTPHGVLPVSVKLGRPAHDAGMNAWGCPCEIWFGDQKHAFSTYGADSMQALHLAIASLDAAVKRGAEKHGGDLYHLDEPLDSMLFGSGLKVREADAASG